MQQKIFAAAKKFFDRRNRADFAASGIQHADGGALAADGRCTIRGDSA
jgi:hypothetical protein